MLAPLLAAGFLAMNVIPQPPQPSPSGEEIIGEDLPTLVAFVATGGPNWTWANECGAYTSWMQWMDYENFQGGDRVSVQEMVDAWFVSALEIGDLRLTTEARVWYVDKLHAECSSY